MAFILPILFYKGDGDANNRTYSLWLNSTGYLSLTSGDGANQSVNTASQLIKLNTWHHVAAVIDRISGQIRIYVDGVEQANGAVRTTPATSSSAPLLLGETLESSASYGHFEGVIDDVRIWNTIRTDLEIQTNLSSELTGVESGLALYLKANDGTGNVVTDSSSNNTSGLLLSRYGAVEGVVAGRIDHVGQRDVYSFALAESKKLYFDSIERVIMRRL